MVEQTILRRLYMKIVAAAIAAISLCLVATYILEMWKYLWVAALALIGFGYTFYSVYRAQKQGIIVSIHAVCVGAMELDTIIDKVQKLRTYRFLAKSDVDDADSIYIRTEKGKFREGETYCLLFKQNPSGKFNESNLLTYGIIPPSFGAETVRQGELHTNAIRFEDISKAGKGEKE